MSDAAHSPEAAAVERGSDASRVGHRLRTERERLGIGLRELARRVGVSPSLVSQIELDRVNPSVSTLNAIVTDARDHDERRVRRARVEERVVHRRDGLAESPETRRVINLASGVRWERLTRESDRDVEFIYVVYPVGAESCPEDGLTTHGGREYGYVSSGTLGVQVGFERVRARPRRLDRVRLVLAPPTVDDRPRAGARDLGRDRPRGGPAHGGPAVARRRHVTVSRPTLRPRRRGGGRPRPSWCAGARRSSGLL